MIVADVAAMPGRRFPARRWTRNLVGGASPIQAGAFAMGYVVLDEQGGWKAIDDALQNPPSEEALFDPTVYGTDALDAPPAKPGGYDAARGAAVIRAGRAFLDRAVPLESGSWATWDGVNAPAASGSAAKLVTVGRTAPRHSRLAPDTWPGASSTAADGPDG